MDTTCKIVKIPKKNGTFRTIYIPNKEYKNKLKEINGAITKRVVQFDKSCVVHGFMPGRNVVTNAQAHINKAFTTCFDLKDFFDTVTPDKMSPRMLTNEESTLVFVDGAARQGLPTSPAVANIAATKLDEAIIAWRKKKSLDFVYTRYADDLSFSYNDLTMKELLEKNIPMIVGRCGFKINPNKTRTMSSKSGRRHITGVAVDDKVYPTRTSVRKLRAAVHQRNRNEAHGLAEWCLCKTPQPKPSNKKKEEYEYLRKLWRLKKFRFNDIPKKSPDVDLGDNCIITGDPAYIMGMSTFTVGWTTCLGHKPTNKNGGKYRTTVMQWLMLAGARVALFLDDSVMRIGPVQRQKIRVRVLVFETKSGLVSGNYYGLEGIESMFLLNKLTNYGVKQASSRLNKEKVFGEVPKLKKKYVEIGQLLENGNGNYNYYI